MMERLENVEDPLNNIHYVNIKGIAESKEECNESSYEVDITVEENGPSNIKI